MKYLIIKDNKFNHYKNENGELFFIPILSGDKVGQFAIFPNSIELFPEVVLNLEYTEAELEDSCFENDYSNYPNIGDYRIIGVFDNYNSTIDIHLYKKGLKSIIQESYNETWDDPFVFSVVENWINKES
jgi:hypothetical protein